jgi:hypothetical protein
MTIHAACECGKRFRAKDEYEGRRAICPACRREFIFKREGIPVFEEAKEPPPIPAIKAEDEGPEPDGTTDPRRPFWKDPIIVFG